MLKNSERGQFSSDVGNIIALIILIAIGAFVTYSVTGPLTEDTTVSDTTTENTASATVETTTSVKSATLTTEYSMDNANDNYWVALNGENIVTLSGSGSGTIENDVTSVMVRGTNTLEAQAESDGATDSDNATLEVTTYAGSSLTNVEEKGSTSFNLMTILVIVVIASVIIGVVLTALATRGGRGRGPAPAY